jgi:hypothetical protein
MEDLTLEPTRSTPSVHLDASSLVLTVQGESYPENSAKFFGPVLAWLDAALEANDGRALEVNLELVYFNSSTSKILFNLFDTLDKAAEAGRPVTINWRYAEDNEMAGECGEEYQNEIHSAVFNLVPIVG